MSLRRCSTPIVVAAGLLLLPALAMAAPRIQPDAAVAQAPDPTPVAPVAPCHMQVRRAVSPRILRAGDAVTVSVEGAWTCDGRSLSPTDLMLVIEDTAALRGVRVAGQAQPLGALKEALPSLIDASERIDAYVGVMRIGSGWHHDLPVAGGAAHFAKIRSLVADLDRPLGGAPHRYLGIRAGSGLMPPGGRQFVLLVDAGQPFRAVTAEQVDHCHEVRWRHGLAVLSLHAAERRYVDCPTPGLFFESTSPEGADLPERMDEIVDALLREQPPTALRYEHPLDANAWRYEPMGVAPRPPDEDRPQRLAWEQPLHDMHEGELAYRYRLRSAPALPPGEVRLSAGPGSSVIFAYPEDSITRSVRAEEVCIHRDDRREEDCGPFVATATASARQASPTPFVIPSRTPAASPPPTTTPTATAYVTRSSWLDGRGCRITVDQSVEPAVATLGSPIDVIVDYAWDCERVRGEPLDIVLVVENTAYMMREEDARGLEQPVNALVEGLRTYVERAAERDDVRIMLLRYATNWLFDTPNFIRLGEDRSLLEAGFSGLLQPIGCCGNLSSGVKAAVTMLATERPADERGRPGLIVLVDGGAVLPTDGVPATAACREARKQYPIAVLELADSQTSDRDCATEDLYWHSTSALGDDIDARIDGLAKRTVDVPRPERVVCAHPLDPSVWRFESAVAPAPVPSERDPRRVRWVEPLSGRTTGGATLRYSLVPDPTLEPGIHRVAADPGASLVIDFGVDEFRERLPDVYVCQHRPDRRAEDCGAIEVGPVPSPTNTPLVPSATATPAPIYLPRAIRASRTEP